MMSGKQLYNRRQSLVEGMSNVHASWGPLWYWILDWRTVSNYLFFDLARNQEVNAYVKLDFGRVRFFMPGQVHSLLQQLHV